MRPPRRTVAWSAAALRRCEEPAPCVRRLKTVASTACWKAGHPRIPESPSTASPSTSRRAKPSPWSGEISGLRKDHGGADGRGPCCRRVPAKSSSTACRWTATRTGADAAKNYCAARIQMIFQDPYASLKPRAFRVDAHRVRAESAPFDLIQGRARHRRALSANCSAWSACIPTMA